MLIAYAFRLGVKLMKLLAFYLLNQAPELIYQSLDKCGFNAGQGTKNGV